MITILFKITWWWWNRIWRFSRSRSSRCCRTWRWRTSARNNNWSGSELFRQPCSFLKKVFGKILDDFFWHAIWQLIKQVAFKKIMKHDYIYVYYNIYCSYRGWESNPQIWRHYHGWSYLLWSTVRVCVCMCFWKNFGWFFYMLSDNLFLKNALKMIGMLSKDMPGYGKLAINNYNYALRSSINGVFLTIFDTPPHCHAFYY